MEEDFSYHEDTQRGQLSSFEITSSGENRHLLQIRRMPNAPEHQGKGGKQFLELRIATTTDNNL